MHRPAEVGKDLLSILATWLETVTCVTIERVPCLCYRSSLEARRSGVKRR